MADPTATDGGQREGRGGPRPAALAVLGPGAVGGLLAALLARRGDSVVVLAGESSAARLSAHGLHVRSAMLGDFSTPVRVAPELGLGADACLVTVKATQLSPALDRVPAAALDGALLVPFLNGIEHVGILRKRYPDAEVVPATIRVEALRSGTGEIEHASPFAAVELAAGPDNRDRVASLGARLADAGLDVSVRDDEAAMLWDKLSFLAPLALVTTHARAPAGVVRTERRDDALGVIHEVATVARATGASVDEAAVVEFLDGVPDDMESSMQRDAAAGRPLELEAIGGAVLRAADQAGVAAPVTARLVSDLRERENAAGRGL